MVTLRGGALALFTLALADLHLSGGRPSVVRDEQRARAAAAAAATGEATSAPLPAARPAPRGEAEAAGGAGTTPGVSLVSLMGRTSEHGGAEESEQTGQRLQRGDYVNQSDDMTDGGLDRKDDFHFDKPDEELVKLEADLKKMCKLEDCHSAYLNLVIFGEELEEPCCKPDKIVCLECLRDAEEKITVLEYGFADSFCNPENGLYTVTEKAWKEYKEDPATDPPGMGSLDPPYTTVEEYRQTRGGTPPASPDTPGQQIIAAPDVPPPPMDGQGGEGGGEGEEDPSESDGEQTTDEMEHQIEQGRVSEEDDDPSRSATTDDLPEDHPASTRPATRTGTESTSNESPF